MQTIFNGCFVRFAPSKLAIERKEEIVFVDIPGMALITATQLKIHHWADGKIVVKPPMVSISKI